MPAQSCGLIVMVNVLLAHIYNYSAPTLVAAAYSSSSSNSRITRGIENALSPELSQLLGRYLPEISESSSSRGIDAINFMRAVADDPEALINDDLLPFFTANFSLAQLESLSWDPEDMFVWAAFQGKELDVREALVQSFEPSLGTCFTFNHPHSSFPAHEVANAGEDYGFTALMLTSAIQYPPWVESSGLAVYIHPRDVPILASPTSPHYFAVPGAWNQMAISRTEYHRLGGIYGACASNSSEVHSYYFEGNYTYDACIASCYQNVVHLTCGCTDPRLPAVAEDIPQCGVGKATCVLNISATHGDPTTWGVEVCDCPVACDETIYNVQVYTSPFSIQGIAAAKGKGVKSSNNASNNNTMNKGRGRGKGVEMVGLSIFFLQNAQQKYSELPAQNFNQYLAYFGGISGLIAGFCMISLVELALLIYRLILTFCTNESVSIEEAQAVATALEEEEEEDFL